MVREIPMSQLGMDPNRILDEEASGADLEPEGEDAGPLFEGLKYHFSWLLGESSIWDGPLGAVEIVDGLGRCRFCGRIVAVSQVVVEIKGTRCEAFSIRAHPRHPGKSLPDHAYCLNCERCGKDKEIGTMATQPKPTRKVYSPDPVLKGGQG